MKPRSATEDRLQVATTYERPGSVSLAPGPVLPVGIVIPVYNASDELRLCLESLVRNTSHPARLVLIDDASTDPAVTSVLAGVAKLRGVQVLRNSFNKGFSATVNRGLRATAGLDVVLLNSDTEVTPLWLQRLVATAYSDPLIATVTPLSDNAGAFSVPEIGASNLVPEFLDYDAASRVIAQSSGRLRPRTPTGNGFCMYIKRAALDEIGELDAEAFPQGYGEENDFCMRALERGWRHVIDDAIFIHHEREASFGDSREQLMRQGRSVVNLRHPQYTSLVQEFVRSEEMARVRETVATGYRNAEEAHARGEEVKPRILFVAHEGSGGTPATNLDLMAALEPELECWLLTSTGRALWLDRLLHAQRTTVERWKLAKPLSPRDFSRHDYRSIVEGILDEHAFELIHVRHLFKHTLDLPEIARAQGIPVVLSFHDYYFTCPTVHLLDDQLQFCGGICTPGCGDCRIPSPALEGLPPLKHRFVYEWREEMQRMFAQVDAFVTTSPGARDVHRLVFPELRGRPFEIIEHGRDLPRTVAGVPPEPGGPVLIAVPTALDVHKGAELMRAILAHDPSGRIEFHLLGEVPTQYAGLGRAYGGYARDELGEKLEQIGPAFVGIFSIWAETYSHVLSEAWAAGIPVISTALGAPRERIERWGGGWLVDPHDPAAAAQTILAVADDPSEYARGIQSASVSNVRRAAEMANDYADLYRRVVDERRPLGPHVELALSRHVHEPKA